MEECSSLRSSDSAGTSEEYEIIEKQSSQEIEAPQLNIANNGNMEDLQQELTEVMKEKTSENSSPNGVDKKTCQGDGVDKKICQGDGVDKKTCLVDGVDKKTCQGDGVDKKTCQGDGVDKKTCQGDGVDKKTCQGDGVDKKTCQGDGVDKKTCQEEGINKKTCQSIPIKEPALPSLSASLPSDLPLEGKQEEEQQTYPRMSASEDCNFRSIDGDDSGDYTIFNRVMYLGAASINAPRSEAEIQRNMAILNAQAQEQALEVSVSVPSNSDGCVIIYDATTGTEMTRFKIDSILFCARGKVEMNEARCFAFTSSHGETPESAIFQCHVFRCQIPEAVARVLITFAATFRRVPKSKQQKEERKEGKEYLFDISLEIKEEDSKGHFNVVPRDKEFFKLKSNTERQLILTVTPAPPSTQISGIQSPLDDLHVERCFGLLIAPGRRVRHADMNLLEMDGLICKNLQMQECDKRKLQTMGWNEKTCEGSQSSKNGYTHGYSNLSHMFGVNEVQVSMGSNVNDKKSYVISGHWDPADPIFDVLNQETPKDKRVSMTVAIDLVMRGIQEPVRFVIETKVRVYPQNERFWYFSKKPLVHLFSLKLKQVEHSPQGDKQYIVLSVDNLGEVERWRPSAMSLSLNLSSLTNSTLSSLSGRSPSIASIETPGGDEESDDDEPLLSGSGEVSKDCPQGELDLWRQVLPKWQASPQQIPKGVSGLVKRGIPEALRGEVWQLLCGCSDDKEMMETYKVLITKECACEQGIRRDINRTFPAHDYFKEAGGVGQDALFKISKAYAVYDEEVGYCQGLSFLAAALLLHMPEEQTFCVLVKVMVKYGLRELFKDGFEILHIRFYQLGKLMEEHLPEIWLHFQEQGVEVHMFASQWFLTLYTAKFPLFMVFHYLDFFLLTGVDSVFQVALALLQMSKKELLSLDFEGILKYFRVSLPKKYRNEDVARQLFKMTTSIKVKRLKKYEKEYLAIKEQEALQEDPVVRLERENRRLLDDNMRLEHENDDLAQELSTSKINMQLNVDKLEDKCEILTKEVHSVNSLLTDEEEEKKRLLLEANQVKELLKREVEKGDVESQRNLAIIADYKKICSQLSERLDKEQAANTQTINMYKTKVSSCEQCSGILSPVTGPPGDITLDESPVVTKLNQQVRELELELAQTKLALVESECKNQDLVHQLGTAMTELQSAKNTWFQKTLTSFSSLKERTASTSSVGGSSTTSNSGSNSSSLQRQQSKDSS